MTLMERRRAMMATGKSGDSLLKVGTYVIPEEMNSYTILQNMDAKCFYKRSMVWMYIISQTPATTGADYTNNNYVMDHYGNSIKRQYFTQVSGKTAPSELLYFGDRSALYADSVASIDSNGRYNWRKPTATVMVPVGAIAVTMEHPLPDPNTGVLDTTPWGG